MKRLKTVLFIISLLINALFLFIIFSASNLKMASLSFFDMDDGQARYTTAAAVVSVPRGGEVMYGPVAVSLARGTRAALQLSVVSDKRQANRLITPLYDRDIIRISETGYGLVIDALAAGVATLQTLTGDGIVDIAVITVTE